MLALLSALFAQLFGTSVLYFVAMKAVMVTLIMIVLPIILKNFFTWIVAGSLSLVSASALGDASPTIVGLTGLAGYFGTNLGLPACFAVILSAVATRFSLKLIPFLRVG